MTVVLSAITSKYAIQISDTRLTDLETESQISDKAVKTVIYQNHYMIGFSGLASLRRPTYLGSQNGQELNEDIKTNIWIAEIVRNAKDINAAVSDIKKYAKESMAHLYNSYPPEKRITEFDVVGWEKNGNTVEPLIIRIKPDAAVVNFSSEIIKLDGAKRIKVVSSKTMPQIIQHTMDEQLAELEMGSPSPENIGAVLLDTVRLLANNDPTISSDAYIASIPINKVRKILDGNPESWSLTVDSLAGNNVGFGYVAEDKSIKDIELKSPTFVVGGSIFGTMHLSRGLKLKVSKDTITFL